MKSFYMIRIGQRLFLLTIYIILFISLSCVRHVTTTQSSKGGMNLYFIRHAETVANATGERTPENYSTLTSKGKKQIDDLTEKLANIDIHHVLVSPTVRTRYTILPYLKSMNKQAEIWPELEEWRYEGQSNWNMNSKSDTILIEPENEPYFQFRDSYSNRWYFARDFAGGLRQLNELVDMIQKRFGPYNYSVLIIGHKNIGSRLIEKLMDLAPELRFELKTAKITHLRQKHNGKFELILLNGEKYKNR